MPFPEGTRAAGPRTFCTAAATMKRTPTAMTPGDAKPPHACSDVMMLKTRRMTVDARSVTSGGALEAMAMSAMTVMPTVSHDFHVSAASVQTS